MTSIRRATSEDLARIEELLARNSLPLDGVRETLPGFAVAENDERIVGAIAVEDCGDYGLLRSAVVDSSARGKGIGRQLVRHALDLARHNRMRALYLLTTTAEDYFPLFGFTRVDRDSVPEPIRQTGEFREACPASATVMKLDLS